MSRELRRQLDEIAQIGWWHPAWLAVVWGTRGLAASGGPRTAAHQQMYRRANGGPDSDTFMVRNAGAPVDAGARADLAAAVARAVVGAGAAIQRLAWMQSRQPRQALQAVMSWHDGWLEPRPLTPREASTAVFVTRRGAYRAAVDAGSEVAVATALTRCLSDDAQRWPATFEPVSLAGHEVVRAAVVASLLRQRIPEARHLHRSAWSRGGGPWLGVGSADGVDVVSTCHLGVDGFGHALLADGICRRMADEAPALAARLRTVEARADAPWPGSPAPAEQDRLGFAARFLANGVGRFAQQAYAMGLALSRFFESQRPGHGVSEQRFSPSFQVPVAPASAAGTPLRDADVFHGLLSVRMRAGRPEPFVDFESRLLAWIERERRGAGVLTEIGLAIAGAALPEGVKLRLLRSRRQPAPALPPVEVLCGRGRLSTLRFPPGEQPAAPLYAASAPALFPTAGDPRGGVVLTIIHHQTGCTVSVLGSGLASTAAGAEAFLDIWLRALDQTQAAAAGR